MSDDWMYRKMTDTEKDALLEDIRAFLETNDPDLVTHTRAEPGGVDTISLPAVEMAHIMACINERSRHLISQLQYAYEGRSYCGICSGPCKSDL